MLYFTGVYLLVTFVLCAIETLLTVFTSRLFDHNTKGYKPGKTSQKLFRFLAKITFYR